MSAYLAAIHHPKKSASIANIIVVDAAARQGIRIDWHRHARIGVPVTLATLAISAVYLWLRARISG